MKRQSIEYEKIFSNHISNKALDLDYVKNFYNSIKNNRKRGLNRHFFREDILIANNHIEKMLT